MTLESRVSLRFQQELCANANRCLVKHIEARSMAAFHSNIKRSIAFHLYNAAIPCLSVTNLDTNSQLSDSQTEFPGPLRRYIIATRPKMDPISVNVPVNSIDCRDTAKNSIDAILCPKTAAKITCLWRVWYEPCVQGRFEHLESQELSESWKDRFIIV